MTWWGIYALTILATPVLLVLCWIAADQRKRRRPTRFTAADKPDWSVAAIRERVKRERAEEDAAKAPTEVLPAVRPKPDELTVKPQLSGFLPKRSRRYIPRPTSFSLRPQPAQPSRELMDRVLDGLKNLPDQPPSQRRADPQSGPETWF